MLPKSLARLSILGSAINIQSCVVDLPNLTHLEMVIPYELKNYIPPSLCALPSLRYLSFLGDFPQWEDLFSFARQIELTPLTRVCVISSEVRPDELARNLNTFHADCDERIVFSSPRLSDPLPTDSQFIMDQDMSSYADFVRNWVERPADVMDIWEKAEEIVALQKERKSLLRQ